MDQNQENKNEDSLDGVIILVIAALTAYFGHTISSNYGLVENQRLLATGVSFLVGGAIAYALKEEIKLLIGLCLLAGIIFALFWFFD